MKGKGVYGIGAKSLRLYTVGEPVASIDYGWRDETRRRVATVASSQHRREVANVTAKFQIDEEVR